MAENSKVQDTNNVACMQHNMIGAGKITDKEFRPNSHPEAQWFAEGGNLGLFIHYGISTVNAKVELSWGMIANKPWEIKMGLNYSITPEEYFKLAERFKPYKFDLGKIIKAIAETGFTYAVFTARHHDGYALWPSKYGEFNTSKYMDGFDLVKLFIDECHKNNIKAGLYYSPPDWYYNKDYMSFNYGTSSGAYSVMFDDRPKLGTLHQPITLPEKPKGWNEQYTKYVNDQIKELLTNYGRIDILWFDGSIDEYQNAISIEEIRKIQPWILVNPRLHHKGDFETFECRMPDKKPESIWEHEAIWADGPWWAYMEQSKGYKSIEWFIKTFEEVKVWNGNFLINVGPKSDGSLPEEFYAKLQLLKNGLR